MKLLTKQDRKLIEAGIEAAIRHHEFTQAKQMEHHLRHQINAEQGIEWDCGPFNESWAAEVAAEINLHKSTDDLYWLAGYTSTRKRLGAEFAESASKIESQAAHIEKSGGGFVPADMPEEVMDELRKRFPNAQFVKIEPILDDETREQFIERMHRTQHEAQLFNEQVSGNETAPEPQAKQPETNIPTVFDPPEDKIEFTAEEEAAEPEGDDQ